MIRNQPRELRKVYHTKLRQLLILALLIVLVIASSRWVFPILLGADWVEAGEMASCMAILVFGRIAFGSLSALEYQGMQGLNLIWNVGRLIVVTASILIPASLGADAVAIVIVYSIVSASWYLMMAVFNEIGFQRVISSGVST